MIYLDTSVALAHLLAEDRAPQIELWDETLVSSRLLEYELWTRIHARGLSKTHAEAANDLLDRLAFIELAPGVLSRARDPFPIPVRTLDALHLASLVHISSIDRDIRLATFDARMKDCARSLGIESYFGQ